jgi:hypothetical protein
VPTVGGEVVDVSDPQRQALLPCGGGPQDPLEDQPAAADPHQLRGTIRAGRRHHRFGARGEQAVPRVGQLRLQRLHHLNAEGVGMVELHHPAPQPRPVRPWPGVAVHNGDPVPAARERHPQE